MLQGIKRRAGNFLRRQVADAIAESPLASDRPPAAAPDFPLGQLARPYYYLGDHRGLTKLSNGLPFFVNTRDRDITTWIVLGGIWETFVDDVLMALARPGQVFLDIGANQGYYSVKLGHAVGPDGAGYCFEPNPELYPFLADNIAINGMTGHVRTYPLAAGEGPGRSVLHFSYANMGGGWIVPPGDSGPGEAGVAVEIASIDAIVPPDRAVDLIKIDAEGFEPLVLRGMRRTLARSPGAAIVAEVSMAQWRRFGDPAAILGELQGGRQALRIGHDGRLRPLSPAGAADLPADFVSYVLLLPRAAEMEAAVARFLDRGGA